MHDPDASAGSLLEAIAEMRRDVDRLLTSGTIRPVHSGPKTPELRGNPVAPVVETVTTSETEQRLEALARRLEGRLRRTNFRSNATGTVPDLHRPGRDPGSTPDESSGCRLE